VKTCTQIEGQVYFRSSCFSVRNSWLSRRELYGRTPSESCTVVGDRDRI